MYPRIDIRVGDHIRSPDGIVREVYKIYGSSVRWKVYQRFSAQKRTKRHKMNIKRLMDHIANDWCIVKLGLPSGV